MQLQWEGIQQRAALGPPAWSRCPAQSPWRRSVRPRGWTVAAGDTPQLVSLVLFSKETPSSLNQLLYQAELGFPRKESTFPQHRSPSPPHPTTGRAQTPLGRPVPMAARLLSLARSYRDAKRVNVANVIFKAAPAELITRSLQQASSAVCF